MILFSFFLQNSRYFPELRPLLTLLSDWNRKHYLIGALNTLHKLSPVMVSFERVKNQKCSGLNWTKARSWVW